MMMIVWMHFHQCCHKTTKATYTETVYWVSRYSSRGFK